MQGSESVSKGQLYLETIRAFSLVVSSCFGVELYDNYNNKIAEFKASYIALGLPISPKVMHLNIFLIIMLFD